MRKLTSFLCGLAACAALATPCLAAGWSFTADTPLSYTFDKKAVGNPIPPNNGTALFTDTTTSNVSGSKVMIIAPFHIGVGYEDYSAQQKITIPPCACSAQGKVQLGIQMVDVMVDIPLRALNIGLGYGSGTARVAIQIPPVIGITQNPARVSAEQTFVVLGLPLGPRFDVHLGYHIVSVQRKVVQDSMGNLTRLQESGQMLSAGLRLNF